MEGEATPGLLPLSGSREGVAMDDDDDEVAAAIPDSPIADEDKAKADASRAPAPEGVCETDLQNVDPVRRKHIGSIAGYHTAGCECFDRLERINADARGTSRVCWRCLPVDELLRVSDDGLIGLQPDRAFGCRGSSG